MSEVTRILDRVQQGEAQAAEELLPLVYEAIDDLAAEDPLQAQVVKLRFFVGLSNPEAANVLGISEKTVRRYETANELARDIECHLSHQPVSAAAPTLAYRMAKYVRRHRRVLATAGAFALLLALGTTISVWQAGRAEKERATLHNARWAFETALPQIEGFLEQDDYTAAFKLVEQARPFIADDPRFQSLSTRACSIISRASGRPGRTFDCSGTPGSEAVFRRGVRDLQEALCLQQDDQLECQGRAADRPESLDPVRAGVVRCRQIGLRRPQRWSLGSKPS